MSEGNGTGKLSGWAIVQLQGVTMIGKWPNDIGKSRLSPVYSLTRGVVANGSGVGLMNMAAPLFGLASLREIDVPEGALIIDVGSLSGQERYELAAAVDQAEQIRKAMASGPSRVALAPPAMSRLVKP